MFLIQNNILDCDFYTQNLVEDESDLFSTEINCDTFTGIEFGLFPTSNENPPEIAAAPAMLALDVATVANILAKVAISKQPLDALEIRKSFYLD